MKPDSKSFNESFISLAKLLTECEDTFQERWQSTEAPDPQVKELEDVVLKYSIPVEEDLVQEIQPNLPWADLHFKERIGGLPLNPGKSYKVWHGYQNPNNDKFRDDQTEKFSHSYMERIWCKKAGKVDDEFLSRVYAQQYEDQQKFSDLDVNMGIRFKYGDVLDVLNLLRRDPSTRQAYLPIWFPEDTGNVMQERVPCTLGYQLIIRDGQLNIKYFMRSCDLLRHFRDDVYLAMRLAYWFCQGLKFHPKFEHLYVGDLTMFITSLHVFSQDLQSLQFRINKYETQRKNTQG